MINRKIILLVFFFASVSVIAQKVPYPFNKPIKTIIEGIYPDTTRQLYVWVTDYSQYIDWLNQKPIIIPVRNGKFRFETYLKSPVYISLGYWGVQLEDVFRGQGAKGDMQIGLLTEPGDSLFVDEKVFSFGYRHMKVSGKGAEKIWAEQALFDATNLFDRPNLRKGQASLGRIGFYDSVATAFLKLLDVYRPKLSLTAYSILKGNYIPMLARPSISEIIANSNLDIQNTKVKEIVKAQIDKQRSYLDLTNPALIYTLYNFERFIAQQPALVQQAIVASKPYDYSTQFSKDRYNAISDYMPDGLYKQRVLANYLNKSMTSQPMSVDIKNAVKDYLQKYNHDNPSYEGVKHVFDLYDSKLAKGAAAFSFSLPDTLGKIHKLDDFKGKVVLIDFMFTYCPGCQGMVPELTKVEHHYKGNEDVVFISVSVDKNRQWEKERQLSNKYHVSGSLYLFTENKGDDHPLIKYYQIRAYPKLVLIDKNGKLISANAPRPDADKGLALTRMIDIALNSK